MHLNPDTEDRDNDGRWKDHCRIYYSEAFYEVLAEACGYELLANTTIRGLRCAAIRKTSAGPFMADRARFLEHVAEREMVPRKQSLFKRLKRKWRGEID